MQKQLSPKQTIIMLLCNYIPFFQIVGIITLLFFYYDKLLILLLALLLWIYIIPPIVARLILLLLPIKNTHINLFAKEYFVWWFVFCLQILYLRLPFLEELMRFIPGLYSMWLRLWGAKAGKMIYWTPGTRVLDRPFINIGDYVVFGADVRINPHVIDDNVLLLSPVTIGNNVTVGAYSLLTAGTILKANQTTKAFLISPPFSIWENNKRIKNDN